MALRVSGGVGPVRVGTTIGGRRRPKKVKVRVEPPPPTVGDYRDAGIRDTVWLIRNQMLLVPDFTGEAQTLAARGEHGAAAETLLVQYLRVHGDTKMSVQAFARRAASLRSQTERKQRNEARADAKLERGRRVAATRERRAQLPARWFLAVGLLVTGFLVATAGGNLDSGLLGGVGWVLLAAGAIVVYQALTRVAARH